VDHSEARGAFTHALIFQKVVDYCLRVGFGAQNANRGRILTTGAVGYNGACSSTSGHNHWMDGWLIPVPAVALWNGSSNAAIEEIGKHWNKQTNKQSGEM
jgi:hypothetical protein